MAEPGCYLIALGSNVGHPRYGPPSKVLAGAVEALAKIGHVDSVSGTVGSHPLGPSKRRYANAAAVLETALAPDALLAALKNIERRFGLRRGQRWSRRVLDLDIILWSGGEWSSPMLNIPHLAFRCRTFVLGPAAAIAPAWRDPISSLTIKQLHTRLTRPRPTPR